MARLRWIAVLIVIATVFSSAYAQTFRGSVTGTVVDSQGAAIANASVKLSDPKTDTIREVKANSAGEFVFPELPVAKYNLLTMHR